MDSNAGDLAALRIDYGLGGLVEEDLTASPFELFARWLREAIEAGIHEPNAMVLATADADGAPSCRMVLLKGYDESGFTFFTNHDSRKGRELAQRPECAVVFPWHPLQRQVRIEGTASPGGGPGGRRLLRHPSPGRPARGLGLTAVPRHRRPCRTRRAGGRGGGSVGRCRADSTTALGWLPDRAHLIRVLAGAALAAP